MANYMAQGLYNAAETPAARAAVICLGDPSISKDVGIIYGTVFTDYDTLVRFRDAEDSALAAVGKPVQGWNTLKNSMKQDPKVAQGVTNFIEQKGMGAYEDTLKSLAQNMANNPKFAKNITQTIKNHPGSTQAIMTAYNEARQDPEKLKKYIGDVTSQNVDYAKNEAAKPSQETTDHHDDHQVNNQGGATPPKKGGKPAKESSSPPPVGTKKEEKGTGKEEPDMDVFAALGSAKDGLGNLEEMLKGIKGIDGVSGFGGGFLEEMIKSVMNGLSSFVGLFDKVSTAMQGTGTNFAKMINQPGNLIDGEYTTNLARAWTANLNNSDPKIRRDSEGHLAEIGIKDRGQLHALQTGTAVIDHVDVVKGPDGKKTFAVAMGKPPEGYLAESKKLANTAIKGAQRSAEATEDMRGGHPVNMAATKKPTEPELRPEPVTTV